MVHLMNIIALPTVYNFMSIVYIGNESIINNIVKLPNILFYLSSGKTPMQIVEENIYELMQKEIMETQKNENHLKGSSLHVGSNLYTTNRHEYEKIKQVLVNTIKKSQHDYIEVRIYSNKNSHNHNNGGLINKYYSL